MSGEQAAVEFDGRDVGMWRLLFDGRVARLRRFFELADDSRGVPPFLVSAEIDLVRAALDALDQLAGDRATREAIRADV